MNYKATCPVKKALYDRCLCKDNYKKTEVAPDLKEKKTYDKKYKTSDYFATKKKTTGSPAKAVKTQKTTNKSGFKYKYRCVKRIRLN